jgi:GGDEF domain-containing protein
VAQRFQSELQRRCVDFSTPPTQPVTATVGIAAAPDDAIEPRTLMRAADRRLYIGKNRGRNCVVSHERISAAMTS